MELKELNEFDKKEERVALTKEENKQSVKL